ncbi:MAG: CDP-diacylglycerol/glycerol-3-phosphate3-phospha tidyltransferase [Frankiales bacterium]|nr:CDP-diacylglycerol/glycerol-3-phosphate3-phospha tidyltransferase [Frankiales bacterium]
MTATAPVPTLNVANALTVLRLLLVPVFLVLLLRDGDASRWGALCVFLVAAWTDRIDGSIARSRGLVTRFGSIADPLADKALTGAALVGLSALGELSWWVTAVVMVREIGVTVLRAVLVRHGDLPVSRGGKWKTALQGLAIGLYVVPEDLGPVPELVMALAVAVTVVTGVDYVVQARRLRAGSARTAGRRGAS